MRNAAKLALVMLAIIVMSATLMGCDVKDIVIGNMEIQVVDDSGNSSSDNDNGVPTAIRPIKEPSGPGFKIGGYVSGIRVAGPMICAVESNYSVFDINAVTLDFSYGLESNLIQFVLSSGADYELVCFALYFCDGGLLPMVSSASLTLDGYHLIKALALDEINSGKYSFTVLRDPMPLDMLDVGGIAQFNHKETVSVPSGVFARNSSEFEFRLMAVQFSNSDNSYRITSMGGITVPYKCVDEYTVQIVETALLFQSDYAPIIYH